jgi:hypothetical protein
MNNLADNSINQKIRLNGKKSQENSALVLRNLQQQDVEECLLGSHRAKIMPCQEKSGRAQLAQTRTVEMQQTIKHQWSIQTQKLITFCLYAAMAATFTIAGQLFTSRFLSLLAIPFSVILGVFIGSLAKDCTTRLFAHCRHKNITQKINSELEKNQTSAKNEFDYKYYQSQIRLLQVIEGNKYLKKLSSIDLMGSVGLTLLESVAGFILALSGGLFIAGIFALLPVVLIIAASAFLSEYIELPKAYSKLIPEYEPYLSPWDDLTESEILDTRRTLAVINYTLESIPGSPIKDREMAIASDEMSFFGEKLVILKEEMVQSLYQCQEKYEAAIKNVETSDSIPTVKRQGLGAEAFQKVQNEAKSESQQQIKQEKELLEKQKETALNKISDTYGLQIYHTQQQWHDAKMRYDAAGKRW